MADKGDKNGSTVKGVLLTILVVLAAFGVYHIFEMFQRAVG